MRIAAEIFEKATIRGFADYLLFGLPPEPDKRDYKARLDETYEEFEKIAFKYNPNGASDLLSAANDMTCENACVYLEIGLQAGILLIVDMFKNMQEEQCGEDEDCCTVSQSMQEDIKKVLDILKGESVENDSIKKVRDILKNWEKPKIKQKEAQ